MRRAFVPAMLALAVASMTGTPVSAALALYASPEALAQRSSLIVEGRVSRVGSGFDPVAGTLFTYVTLDVDRVHRGPADLESLTLREPGGRFGNVVHEVDAVPSYGPGDEVLAFLEPAADGALRTAGMFLGKFDLQRPPRGPEQAVRRLDGEGRSVRGVPAGFVESFPLHDLAAVAAGDAGAVQERTWRARPAELGRLRWDDVRVAPWVPTTSTLPGASNVAPNGGTGSASGRFAPLEPAAPARWNEVDRGEAVRLDVRLDGNPLHDAQAALDEIRRAMSAWNDVPESRLELQTGSLSGFVPDHEPNPTSVYSGVRIILFDDPYEDISDPVNCAGVLAIGGLWRTVDPVARVNGVSFAQAIQAYVVFNDGFECYLEDPDNLAEIAAHELGHVLGFGHSERPDALMRGWPWGDSRGPRLGDDDADAVHCHYPHRLNLLEPRVGDGWEAGGTGVLEWESSDEASGDAGTVTIELSTDGGQHWSPIASEVANDGHHEVRVPSTATEAARVRLVRYNRLQPSPVPYPSACTRVTSAPFSIEDATRTGPVRDGFDWRTFWRTLRYRAPSGEQPEAGPSRDRRDRRAPSRTS